MAFEPFLPRFSDPNYTNVNRYEFERRPERPPRAPMFEYGDDALWREQAQSMRGLRSGGLINQVGKQQNPAQSQNPTAGLLGVENTTGFAQSAPNVTYDPGPEQFEKNLKLQNRQVDVQEMQAKGMLEQNRALNESRYMNADANRMRAEVAAYKAANPNAIIKEMGEGFVAIDPQTNEVTRIGSGLRERIAGQQYGYDYSLGEQRNRGDLAEVEARNRGNLETARERGLSAFEIAVLVQQGLDMRQINEINSRMQEGNFQQLSSNWRTRANEYNDDPGPEPKPPSPIFQPQKDYFTNRQNRPDIRSTPGGSVGTVLPQSGIEGSLQLQPNQMGGFGKPQGFQAAPGQFTAKPNQYTPAPAPPIQGGQVGELPPTSSEPEDLRNDAIQQLREQNIPINEGTLQKAIQKIKQAQLQSKSQEILGAGTFRKDAPTAGQLAGPTAGTVVTGGR